MRKRWLVATAVAVTALGTTWSTYAKQDEEERYASYIEDTYGEDVEVTLKRDWKMGGYAAEFTLTDPILEGDYWAETYRSDQTIHDNVLEHVWQQEAEDTFKERLEQLDLLTEAETVRASVPTGVDEGVATTVRPTPTSVFDVESKEFLDVSIMFHEDWANTDAQKQRMLDVIRALEDDVYSVHFSFDGTPYEDDDFTERYLNVARDSLPGEPAMHEIQTIEDLNRHDRLYGFDETTFIHDYHFDGTKYED